MAQLLLPHDVCRALTPSLSWSYRVPSEAKERHGKDSYLHEGQLLEWPSCGKVADQVWDPTATFDPATCEMILLGLGCPRICCHVPGYLDHIIGKAFESLNVVNLARP